MLGYCSDWAQSSSVVDGTWTTASWSTQEGLGENNDL